MAHSVEPVPGYHLSEPTVVSVTRHRHRAVDATALAPSTVTLVHLRPTEDSHAVALRRELQTHQLLADHAHVLPIIGGGFTPDRRPYFVHPRIGERSLADLVDSGPVPVKRILDLGIKVASALHVAHRRGIVHGQLRPQVVFIEGSEPLLTDFGITSLNEPRIALGTDDDAPFNAPEDETTPAADRFAFGMLVRTMLEGPAASTGDEPPLVHHARERLGELVDELTDADPALRPELDHVVAEFQQLQSQQRYPVTSLHPTDGTPLDRGSRTARRQRRQQRQRGRADVEPDHVGALLALVAGVLIASVLIATAVVMLPNRSSDVATINEAAVRDEAALSDGVRQSRLTGDDGERAIASATPRAPSATIEAAPSIQLVDPAVTTPDEVLGTVVERGSRPTTSDEEAQLWFAPTAVLNQAPADMAFSVAELRFTAPAVTGAPVDTAYVLEVVDAAGDVRGSNLCDMSSSCEHRMRFEPALIATTVRLRPIDEAPDAAAMTSMRWCIVDASGVATSFSFPAAPADAADDSCG